MPLIDDPENLDAVKIAELAQDNGYRGRASDEDVKNYVISAMAGLDVFIWIYDNKNIQFRCIIADESEAISLDKINKFNRNWRYSKIYKDEKTIVLEADFFFDINNEAEKDNFGRMLRIVDGSTALLKNIALGRE